ncbi:MAG TPA: phasin family protein [Casimicrobiaceae bacterium]|nr:phasin family protein [Casimicrobiaceae bacterium]
MPNQQQARDGSIDIRSLWGFNGETFDFAERAYRNWQKGAEQIQSQALDYFNNEMTKALEAMREMAQCETAAEAIGVQSRYANEAMQDLWVEGRRMMDQIASITQTPWTMVPTSSAAEAHEDVKRRRKA